MLRAMDLIVNFTTTGNQIVRDRNGVANETRKDVNRKRLSINVN